MNIANIKKCDVANGEGVRVSIFVSGCRRHCDGCFNEEAWDFNYGKPFTKEIEEEIIEALKPSYIRGLSILGGEPMEPENESALIPFVKRVRKEFPEKDIWLYSGYTFDEICDRELLRYVDILVDGPFDKTKKNASLAFKGSSNQTFRYILVSSNGHVIGINIKG